MKLKNAMICLNCDEVFEYEIVEFLDQKILIGPCPACGSQHSHRLCTWIPTIGTIKNIIYERAQARAEKGNAA